MSFSEKTIQGVWEKGEKVSENNKDHFRKDKCGAWIAKSQYGNRDSIYGWEIDHIIPRSDGGHNELPNLRPLQWENNMAKSDGKLRCVVIAEGDGNVKK